MSGSLIRANGAIGLVAALALIAAGCGSSNNDNKSSSSTPKTQTQASSGGASAPGTLAENATDFKFSQPNPTVKAKNGAVTVTLRNSGGVTHAIEIQAPKGEFRSKQISPGQTTQVTAKLAPGTYQFYCPVDGHKMLGMKGKIKVQ
jgi:uncharacterized cupredoxin-like copper-binding protein